MSSSLAGNGRVSIMGKQPCQICFSTLLQPKSDTRSMPQFPKVPSLGWGAALVAPISADAHRRSRS